MTTIVLLLAAISFFSKVDPFPAYNCEKNLTSIATISLSHMPVCQPTSRNTTTSTVKIAMTQTATYGSVPYIACKVSALHLLSRCGKTIDTFHAGALSTEEISVSKEKCRKLISDNVWNSYKNGILYPIEIPSGVNHHSTRFTSVGSISSDGSCTPGNLNLDGVDIDRPLRQTTLSISFVEGTARVDYESKKLVLPSGVECDYLKESCYSLPHGNVYWSMITPTCNKDSKESILIYRGSAEEIKRINHDTNRTETFLQVHQGGYDFQIKLHERTTYVCGFKTFYTEHPKVFLTYLPDGEGVFPALTALSGENADLLMYINSKIVYSMRHVESEVNRLFDLLQYERCKSEKKIIANLLTLATTDPRAFAYEHFEMKGLTAITRGEVIHIAKCQEVDVRMRKRGSECYNELPVVYNNETYYLHPRSHILTKVGTVIDCAHDVSPQFFIEGEWVVVSSSGLVRAKTPQTLMVEPMSYKFESFDHIVGGGIYEDEMMAEMQRAFLIPLEEPIITTRLVSSIRGGVAMPDGMMVSNTFSDRDYEKISEGLGWWENVSRRAKAAGSWSGLIFMILLSCKVVSSLLNWILNYKVLSRIFGPCIAISVFWWDSMTHMIVSGNIMEERMKKFRRVPAREEAAGGIDDDLRELGGSIFRSRQATAPLYPNIGDRDE